MGFFWKHIRTQIIFYSEINAVQFFGNIFFEKKLNCYLFLHLFSISVYLLPSFINERSHNTLSMVAESAIEHILIAIVLLYGFESVFCQVLFDFLFVVYMFFL